MLCEWALCESIKNSDETMSLKWARTSYAELRPYRYDSAQGVIEFRTTRQERLPRDCQWLTPRFTMWEKPVIIDTSLPVKDQALVMFHLGFNPALEVRYDLPDDDQEPGLPRFIGDKSFILELTKHDNDSWHILSAHVSLSWIFFGISSKVMLNPIYPDRYERLCNELMYRGKTPSLPYSLPESALRYLTIEYPQRDDFPENLMVGTPSQTRLWQMQEALESVNLDPLLVWKYGIVKAYIAGKSSIAKEEILQKIEASEADWEKQRERLIQHSCLIVDSK
ncbi:hypothetical protein EC973_007203 [Apophysomyces ossiformis]|uniref:Uncharacterized protein n=1 Tax=Apophysomyces ossiformis TaxID=679940 RepID=A0A8H7BSC2_9FUNG|nr:hypothetical protein EC973_007203 [Apophysomyces ossiformis]